MSKYKIIIEKTDTGYSAYVPDLGCITVAESVEETREYIKEAMELYIEQLKSEGKAVPEPKTISGVISV